MRPRAHHCLGLLFLPLHWLTPASSLAADRSPEADIPGWGETRWGMTGADLDALFGPDLQRLDPPLQYARATVDRALPQAEFDGLAFRALFQMDRDGRLQQVLLERGDAKATPEALAAALGELEDRFGQPDRVCDTPQTGAETSPVERERVWVLPTTVIHLSWLDYRGGILYHDPEQDIDPLVPDWKTRLYARRSLPRRLLVRFHPAEREDLMGACRANEAVAPPPAPAPE